MSTRPEPLQLPESLERQLLAFRRSVWTIKLVEAIAFAGLVAVLAFLLTFGLDRLADTPPVVRGVLLMTLLAGGLAVPWALYRWVWRQRRLDQLARLLTRRHRSIGDQLLGIIELVHSPSEQARSRALCEAAIVQVADQARDRDFRDAVPRPRHRRWASAALVGMIATSIVSVLYPAAAQNAWARLLAPWRGVPRYTFTMIEELPSRLVVAYGEPFALDVALRGTTRWRPDVAQVELAGQPALKASLSEERYRFSLPGQMEETPLRLRVGDLSTTLSVQPMLRPELTSVDAKVTLPSYLDRSRPLSKDVRGGAVTFVKGSRAEIVAVASRELARAQVNQKPVAPRGAKIPSRTDTLEKALQVEFQWEDRLGLAGKEPFKLAIETHDDEAPTVTITNLPRQKVVLDSEQLTFNVLADDDFGIKQVGIEWQGFAEVTADPPAQGERILAAGGGDRESLELTGTFSAKTFDIPAQPLQVRLFVEDYLPGRERVYSPTYTLYVLTPEQHAVWLTEQLSKWHRQSLEVRDRELQLFEANKQLRELSAEQLDLPETRRRLESQAVAERANGRRLAGLTASGEELVQQAMRNPEFGVGHLEKWAEMLQILKDISSNRMPSVAELLQEASQAQALAQNPSPSTPPGQTETSPPQAGQVRAGGNAGGGQQKPDTSDKAPPVPQIVDVESSQGLPGDEADAPPEDSPSSGSAPRLTLPTTTLVGGAKAAESCPVAEKMEIAIEEQRKLLAEFDKVAEELNRVLANLEGSTLVKRLKAAARLQYNIAGRISDGVADTFGVFGTQNYGQHAELFHELSEQEIKSSQTVSLIMDDMQAYFERRRLLQFKSVLDEMRELDVIGGLRKLAGEISKEEGLSIAQCEYWSDTLDRWAEDLVDPTSGGT